MAISSTTLKDEEEEEVECATPNETNQMHKEPEVEDINPQEPIDLQSARIPKTMDTIRSKRQHISDTSDSDKDNPQLVANTMLALISPTKTQGWWRKVEKKQGRKA